MKRRMRGEAVARVQLERLVAPVEEGEGVGVREHHALGLPGRARGIEDVREVVLIHRRGQRRGRVVGHHPVPRGVGRAGLAIAHDDEPGQGAAFGPGGAEGLGVLGEDDDRLHAGVGQDARPPDRRRARVDRDIRRARAQHAVDGRDGLPPLGQEEPHAISPAHAPAMEARRQPVGRAEQLAICSNLAAFVLDGRMVGSGRGRAVQELAEVVSVLAHDGASYSRCVDWRPVGLSRRPEWPGMVPGFAGEVKARLAAAAWAGHSPNYPLAGALTGPESSLLYREVI